MDKFNQTHQVAAYIRVSTEEQAKNPEGSIKNQEQRIRREVEHRNLNGAFGELVEVYIDRARSGGDTKRPELQRLLKDIAQKKITLVMVTELSRLSRSIRDFSGMWELMRSHGCEFISLREAFESGSAAGEMMMYLTASMAQFERRQVSERVSANFNARAARGLYNGGVLPLGYELDPERKGTLRIDPEGAAVVRAAFAAFLREETLASTAKWLNENGYRMKRITKAGGYRRRLGHFTVQNLHDLLRNKSHAGIRHYRENGEIKETQAAWEPIVDRKTFERVQKLLKKNHRKKKPHSEKRYPFLLTSLINCNSCGSALVGKSAHGNGGKIPYYDHGSRLKSEHALPRSKRKQKCQPDRVQAKKLEPLVWEQVEKLLTQPKMAEELINEAWKLHRKNGGDSPEKKAIEGRVKVATEQVSALAERLGELPQSVSARPIYEQMARLEAEKEKLSQRLRELNSQESEAPALPENYQEWIHAIRNIKEDSEAISTKTKIVRSLIHKVDVLKEGFRLHYYTGEDWIQSLTPECKKPRRDHHDPGGAIFCLPERSESAKAVSPTGQNFLGFLGSNTLTNGRATRDRTWNGSLGKICYIHLTMAPKKETSQVDPALLVIS